jgi:hypothetical protein
MGSLSTIRDELQARIRALVESARERADRRPRTERWRKRAAVAAAAGTATGAGAYLLGTDGGRKRRGALKKRVTGIVKRDAGTDEIAQAPTAPPQG